MKADPAGRVLDLIDGLSMMALFWAKDALTFILLFGVLGGVGSIGTSRVVAGVLIPKWFIAKRGMAMGMALMYGLFLVVLGVLDLRGRA